MQHINFRHVARGAIIFIFLGLIRTISEPMRLQYYAESELLYEQVLPFLIAAEAAAVGLFAMTLLAYYKKYRLVVLVGALTLGAMLFVKVNYLI